MAEDVVKKSEESLQQNGDEADLQELKMQLEDAQCLAEERLDQFLRCRADLDNVIKRAAKNMTRAQECFTSSYLKSSHPRG
jgi:molecular chaperone GrpE